MQKGNAKVGKISIFSFLDVKLKFLTNRVELTQFSVGSSHVKLKIWATRLESSWKCEQLDSISIWVQNVNLKLDLIISLKQLLIILHSIISFRCSFSLTSAISIDALLRTFRKLFVQWFNSLKRRSYLNEMKFVRTSLIIWRNVWSKLLYYVTLIKLMRLFLKLTHLTTLTMKFSLNMMMKKYYIQLSSIARTCFLLNATMKYMIKNFWSSFEHLNTDDSNWS